MKTLNLPWRNLWLGHREGRGNLGREMEEGAGEQNESVLPN